MSFTVSAPGKIILAGEHAVVYGYRGIASSINLRCQATVKLNEQDNKIVRLHLINIPFDFEMNEIEFNKLLSNVGKHIIDPTTRTYQQILNEYLDEKMSPEIIDDVFIRQGLLVFIDLCLFLLEKCWRAVDISVNSEFSYGCGLGSSAAYSTVLATSLLLIKDSQVISPLSMSQLQCVSSLAFRGEQIVHGTPSGIDNCISAFGGSLLYQRSELSVMRQSVVAPHLPVLLVDTRVKRCTKTVVKHIQKLTADSSELYHRWFSAIDQIAMLIVDQLTEVHPGRAETLSKLVVDNQALLRSMGVSHSSIEEIVSLLCSYGISAKLTGAGWGGCVFAFVEGVSAVVLETAMSRLTELNYAVYLTHLNCPGVQVQMLQ